MTRPLSGSFTATRAAALIIMFSVALLASIAAPSARAQQPPALSITTVDATAYPTITAVVTAIDAAGAPVAGLTAADFQAFEAEAPLTLSALQTERLNLSVAVVIDVSGSMQGQAIVAAKAAAQEFVLNLAPEDSASIFAFSTAVRQVSPFTADKAQLAAAIDGLQAAGDTSLFEAAQTAVFAMNNIISPRKAIVLMTDGENVSPSPVTLEGSLAVVGGARIPVYSIGFGPGPDTSYLQTIAQATNGQYRAADAGSVSAVYANISALLNNQYTLTITAPEPERLAGASMLRLTTTLGGQPAEASAAFDRPGSAAPAPTAPAVAVVPDEPSDTPLYIYGGVVGMVLLAVMAIAGGTVFQRTRTRRRQLAVVRPNFDQAAAQPLPQAPGTIVADIDDGTGRLTSLDSENAPTYDFASTPLHIGSAHDCDVRLPASPEVGGRHALIWMKDGKIMLRHTGGPRRPTLVAGRPIEWVILDSGDEFVVGGHAFHVERS